MNWLANLGEVLELSGTSFRDEPHRIHIGYSLIKTYLSLQPHFLMCKTHLCADPMCPKFESELELKNQLTTHLPSVFGVVRTGLTCPTSPKELHHSDSTPSNGQPHEFAVPCSLTGPVYIHPHAPPNFQRYYVTLATEHDARYTYVQVSHLS